MAPGTAEETSGTARTEIVVVELAMIAALAVKVPELFGHQLNGEGAGFYPHNLSLCVLPLFTGYFARKCPLRLISCCWLGLPFAAALAFANAVPFPPEGATEVLKALHLPIALWLVVNIAYYAGGHWRNGGRRMDFVRFSGELFIYYVPIAFGGVALEVFILGMFVAIGLDVEWLAESLIGRQGDFSVLRMRRCTSNSRDDGPIYTGSPSWNCRWSWR